MNVRKPKDQYRNRNGFEEFTRQFPTESMKDAEAAEAQDLALFVTREMGSFFPSLEEMKREIEAPETLGTINERIKGLKKEQADGMSKLARYCAQGEYDDAMDRYLQTDDLKYFDDLTKDDEWAEHYERLEGFFRRSGRTFTSECGDILARAQYDHLQELLPLYVRRRALEESDEAVRIKRTAQFPQTVQEYRSMKETGAQLRVAHFLLAGATKREEMRNESRWTRKQTEPLIEQFSDNDEFHQEIQKIVVEYGAKDPRARYRA
ncbi:hypothetical protein M0805_005071 [Coniferiporia weirii]|nr:hypothetical protein M0805_005071 [Coniferiporia weirii]